MSFPTWQEFVKGCPSIPSLPLFAFPLLSPADVFSLRSGLSVAEMEKQDVWLRRRPVESSSFFVNNSAFLRKSPRGKRKHCLRRPSGTFLTYVHMLLCTATPTSRHVAPPLDLGRSGGARVGPLPHLERILRPPRVSLRLLCSYLTQSGKAAEFFFFQGGVVGWENKNTFSQWLKQQM